MSKLNPPDLGVEDVQVGAAARLAAVHVRYGELRLPPRIATSLAAGPAIRIVVTRHRALRGVEHVVDLDAHRAGDRLSGIAWPDGVVSGTTVRLSCARRADVLRLCLPAIGAAARQLAADETGESTLEAPVVAPGRVAAVLEPAPAPTADAPTEVFAVAGTVPGTLPDMPVEGEPAAEDRVRAVLDRYPEGVAALFDRLTLPGGVGAWFRRNLTPPRVAVLCLALGVLAGTGIGWWLA